MNTEPENRAKDQAAARLETIKEYVAALSCDYARLEELRDERESYDAWGFTSGPDLWKGDNPSEAEELAELEAQAGEFESVEQVRERIQEDPLSVQVRSGWYNPGDSAAQQPEEFEVLLCTGGPAVRIMGELNEYNEPGRAWLEYQDWGTPWTHYYEAGASDVLLTYCQQFYFGA